MRPDRIIVGEVRGAESLDMLQAMNTGHDGSLTTIHANSARDALHRLEMLVLMAAQSSSRSRPSASRSPAASTSSSTSGDSSTARVASHRSRRSGGRRRRHPPGPLRRPCARARRLERPGCWGRCTRRAFGPASCPSSAPTASSCRPRRGWVQREKAAPRSPCTEHAPAPGGRSRSRFRRSADPPGRRR